MKHLFQGSFCAAIIMLAMPAFAEDITVKMFKATQDGTGDQIGTITISQSGAGATLRVALHGLPPGEHGIHIHENPNCGPTLTNGVRIPAGAAGGHLDPEHTGKHEGPGGEGHLGDLPALEVAASGSVNQALIAPRIKNIDDLKGHAVVVHAGGDNYKDSPAPLGGGGARLACGVIE